MARIVGGLTTSHVPAIGGAIAKGLQAEPYWKPFFDGFLPVRKWLDEVKPEVAVVFYNDHGLNFFLDKMPTFAIGAATEIPERRRGLGTAHDRRLPGRSAALLASGRIAANVQLVELAGTQGVELLMWIAARATLRGSVSQVHRNYHIPISNTASGVLVLEP